MNVHFSILLVHVHVHDNRSWSRVGLRSCLPSCADCHIYGNATLLPSFTIAILIFAKPCSFCSTWWELPLLLPHSFKPFTLFSLSHIMFILHLSNVNMYVGISTQSNGNAPFLCVLILYQIQFLLMRILSFHNIWIYVDDIGCTHCIWNRSEERFIYDGENPPAVSFCFFLSFPPTSPLLFLPPFLDFSLDTETTALEDVPAVLV